MENSRKHLKEMSILVLLFAALTLIKLIANLAINGLAVEVVPDGISKGLAQGIVIATFVIALLLLLPQVFIGVRGLKVSANPDSSRGYIVLTKVLFVFAVIAAVSSLFSLFGAKNVVAEVINLVDALLDVIVYFLFIKYATEVANAA